MKVVSTNRRAGRDYHILMTIEAGIVLQGAEVKSLRQGAVSLSDAYARIDNGQIYLLNLHISPYKFSHSFQLEPKRRRKLLLKKREIKKLYGLITQRGNTLIPLKVYFNDRGFAKVLLGVCRRKRTYDKKERLIERELKARVDRIKKRAR